MAEIKIQGLSQLQKRLDALPEKLQRKVYREAVRVASEPLREEVSRRARRAPTPTHPEIGHLADNIEVVVRKVKDEIRATTHTGRAYWGSFLEFGRFPFMRPALDQKGEEVLRKVAKELEDGIEKNA